MRGLHTLTLDALRPCRDVGSKPQTARAAAELPARADTYDLQVTASLQLTLYCTSLHNALTRKGKCCTVHRTESKRAECSFLFPKVISSPRQRSSFLWSRTRTGTYRRSDMDRTRYDSDVRPLPHTLLRAWPSFGFPESVGRGAPRPLPLA